jgi:hypothetical protein
MKKLPNKTSLVPLMKTTTGAANYCKVSERTMNIIKHRDNFTFTDKVEIKLSYAYIKATYG